MGRVTGTNTRIMIAGSPPAEFSLSAEWPSSAVQTNDPPTKVDALLSMARQTEVVFAELRSQPLSCDLTGDKIACAILKAWARQPWEPVHQAALLDRMEELGKSEEERAWLQGCNEINWREFKFKLTRTDFARMLKAWRRVIIEHFGDFESKYSL